MEFTDVAREISIYLDNETLEKLFLLGVISSLSFSDDILWWRRRVEVLSGVSSSFIISNDISSWKKAYLLLEEELAEDWPSFTNPDDNDIVTRILLAMGFDPSYSGGICCACECGCVKVLKILLEDGRINPDGAPGYYECLPIVSAVREGDYECVKLLLEDGRADPSVDNDWPLREARARAHKKIEELLLEDSRVDPDTVD